MLSDKEHLYVGWHDVELQVKHIVDHLIIADLSIMHVFGIGRGGLIPAAMIAYHFGKRKGIHLTTESVVASSYNNQERGSLTIYGQVNTAGRGTYTLIVDDIADSGATLSAIKGLIPNAHTAVLVHKETSSVVPDFAGHVDKDGHKWWYVFPWERPTT